MLKIMDICGLRRCAYEETLRGKLVLDKVMISCVGYSLDCIAQVHSQVNFHGHSTTVAHHALLQR